MERIKKIMNKKILIAFIAVLLAALFVVGGFMYAKKDSTAFVCPGTSREAFVTFNGSASDRWKKMPSKDVSCNWELIPGNSVKVKVPATYKLDYWTGREAGSLQGPGIVDSVVQGTMWKVDNTFTQ